MDEDCIICDKPGDGSYSVASEKSFMKIKSFCEDWSKIGKYNEDWNRLQDLTFSAEKKMYYHRTCYQTLCHKGNLSWAQKNYEKAVASAAAEKARGRPSDESMPGPSKKRKIFDQDLCVFCQLNLQDQVAYSVRSAEMGQKFLNIKETTTNTEVQARLVYLCHEMDAFAQNMKYHTTCLRRESRHSRVENETSSQQDNIGKAI